MKEIINKIFESPLLQNSVKISISNIIMYMLPFVVTSILARLYTPEAFGEWGVFSSFVAIVNIGLFMGFENVIAYKYVSDNLDLQEYREKFNEE